MPQTDVWVVAPDGRIGVVSASDYHRSWFQDGTLTESGPRISYTPLAVTAAARDSLRARKAIEGPGGQAGRGMSSDAASALGKVRAKAVWPDSLFPARMPLFEPGGALRAPNGEIWLKRLMPDVKERPELISWTRTGSCVAHVVSRLGESFLGSARTVRICSMWTTMDRRLWNVTSTRNVR